MVFCGESIITEISVYVFFYMSEFIIQSTLFIPYKTLFKLQGDKKKIVRKQVKRVTYTCPICDATVKGKEGLHILCGDCQEEMQVNLK